MSMSKYASKDHYYEAKIAELKQQRDHLESENAKQAEMLNKVIEQRDELFAILQALREWNGDLVLRDYIDAAIAKVKPYQGLPTTGTT